MPWCEPCAKYLSPNALTKEGQCGECGFQCVEEKAKWRFLRKKFFGIPWHLWILIVVLGGYLIWRLIQLIVWLAT